MKKITNTYLNECFYKEVLPNGLTVIIYPKNDFKRIKATICVKYGGSNLTFKENDKVITSPQGVAHYLEHLMFRNEDGTDAGRLFSELGATSNAFTTNTQTCYYFSTVNNFYPCLDILMDFVSHPYFTEENVQNERGIIAQEIASYEDEPSYNAYMAGLDAIYETNPFKYDIAGTVEEINKINASIINECYHAFYKPSNMILVVAGNVNQDECFDYIANSNLGKVDKGLPPVILYADDDTEIREKEVTKYLDDILPTYLIMFKFNNSKLSELENLKFCFAMDICLNAYFADSSNHYQELIKKRILNDSFEYGYSIELHYGFMHLSVSDKTPDKFFKQMEKFGKELKHPLIDIETFKHYQKSVLVSYLKTMDSFMTAADYICDYDIHGLNYFDNYDVISGMTYDDFMDICGKFDYSKYTKVKVLNKKDK